MNRLVRGGLALACATVIGSGMFAGIAGAHAGMVLPEGEYTPEQEDWAMDIVHRTEEALPRYVTGDELRAQGFENFGAATLDGYWHWTNTSRIDDGKLLDPTVPESLVIRQTPDGLKVEAAMFFLDSEHTMDTIPEDLQWIPGWHTHDDELCVDENGTFAGLQGPDGTCYSGTPFRSPPMMHVWTVDTHCGHRFAGLGPMGLDCLYDGGHGHGPHGPDHGPGGTTPGTMHPHPIPTTPTSGPGDGNGGDGNGNGSNGNGDGNGDGGDGTGSAVRPSTAVRPASAVRATPTFAG